ncbi:isochorismatase family protein [Flavobacterium zhairuonense]|uniref:isochorismatase family protein n=1 Tax=Flavobacterium zhairuonense TaxID=2493631 RepID=UPI001045538E|nr:isochorismatase family protein [Flavobacterium zhairuonense]KAF2508656.1 isochorismatase family protein [Flavobacterium zhairuonense]
MSVENNETDPNARLAPDNCVLILIDHQPFQHECVSDWIRATGKKKIVIAALWTEICNAMPVIPALGEGYEFYFITDETLGISLEAHEMAVMRMLNEGAIPITWAVFGSEFQGEYSSSESLPQLSEILMNYMENIGTCLTWNF